MKKRRKIFLICLTALIAILVIGIQMLGQPTQETEPDSPANTIPPDIPENLFVVPEVPFGTIAVLFAILSALLVVQLKSKRKLQQP